MTAADVIVILDADDPRLHLFRRNDRELSDRAVRRDDSSPGLFLAEGDLVVERALDAGYRPVAGLADPGSSLRVTAALAAAGASVYAAGEAIRRDVLRLGVVQPIIAVFHRPPRPNVADLVRATNRILAVEAVDNPANVGSIVRNAAALGWGGIVLDRTSADPLARRALRVAMGTTFAIAHARTADLAGALQAMARDGWATVALSPDEAAVDLRDVDPFERCAIVIGSERAGLSAGALAACTHRVRIAMELGIDSLNAAAASAIACYALA